MKLPAGTTTISGQRRSRGSASRLQLALPSRLQRLPRATEYAAIGAPLGGVLLRPQPGRPAASAAHRSAPAAKPVVDGVGRAVLPAEHLQHGDAGAVLDRAPTPARPRSAAAAADAPRLGPAAAPGLKNSCRRQRAVLEGRCLPPVSASTSSRTLRNKLPSSRPGSARYFSERPGVGAVVARPPVERHLAVAGGVGDDDVGMGWLDAGEPALADGARAGTGPCAA